MNPIYLKWRVRTPRAGEAAGVEIYSGDDYVCQMSHHPAQRKQALENAERIVACVNAFRGTPTEQIDGKNCIEVVAHKIGDDNLTIKGELIRMTAQRDELLAALEKAFPELDKIDRHCLGWPFVSEPVEILRAAIARVKGGAA